MAVEGGLEHARARRPDLVEQMPDIGCHHPQVLRDEWQRAEFLQNGCEEARAGPLYPASATRRGSARRNVPCGCEAAEMIQADYVHVGQRRAYAVDVPPIAAFAQCLPVIYGIAPEAVPAS